MIIITNALLVCLSSTFLSNQFVTSQIGYSAHDLQMLTTKGYFIFWDKSEINPINKLVNEGIVAEVLITLNTQLKLVSTMI